MDLMFIFQLIWYENVALLGLYVYFTPYVLFITTAKLEKPTGSSETL
jgi:hypothetical protein